MTQNKDINHIFYGEPPLFFVFAVCIAIIIIGFPWLALFLTFGWFGKLVLLLVLFAAGRFIIKNTILRVAFQQDAILVNYLFGKKHCLPYEEVEHFMYNHEGFLPLKVVVAKLKHEKSKKFHFYLPDSSAGVLTVFLLEKGLTIRNQQ
jgi:hypothetical protein